MFSTILLLWLLVQGFSLWGLWFFEQELMISFLPYIIGVNIIIIATLIIVFIYHNRRKYIFFIIAFGIIGWLCYLQLSSTYYDKPKNQIYSESLSLFYANIYYKNNLTDSLIKKINQLKPDIIMLVEYSKNHDQILTPILKKEYPYVSRYIGEKGYDGDIIFSKVPMKNIDHTIHPWSFSHVSLLYNNKFIDIALVHTSAPVSKKFFNMRIHQLNELKTLIYDYYKDPEYRWDRDIIIAGDFNISPWSPYYRKQLQYPLESLWFENITTNLNKTSYRSDMPYLSVNPSVIDCGWATELTQ